MGSKTDAILDPEQTGRFYSYLSDEDQKYIYSGATQNERIRRLKERFEAFFMGETDTRGSHFIDDDVTGDSDYPRALMKLYNCAEAREYREKHFPDLHKRKQAQEVEDIIRAPQKPPAVEEQPKKIISVIKGYRNKEGTWIKPYNRTISQSWSKRESKWLANRVKESDNRKLVTAFNAKFGTMRTVSSLGTKKLRLRRMK
jgi:hypothetical protein